MSGGKIKKVIEDRGFGFIKADDGRKIFIHMSELQGVDIKDLKEGDSMEFDVEMDPPWAWSQDSTCEKGVRVTGHNYINTKVRI